MSQRKNSGILIGGVILAAVLVLGLITLLNNIGGSAGGPRLEQDAQLAPSQAQDLAPVSTSDPDASRMAAILDPALTIIPVNPSGLPLHTAKIVVRMGGEMREATGRGEWEDIPVGEWEVEITSDGFMDAHERVTVIDGGQADLVVTMHRSIEISGQIVDTFGATIGGTLISFQKAEPTSEETRPNRGRGIVTTQPDGTFATMLKDSGDYHVAVGPLNAPLLEMEEPIELVPGVHELDVVIQGLGSVELSLTDLPAAARTKEGLLTARIYTRKAKTANTRERKGPGLHDPSAPQRGTPPSLPDAGDDATSTAKRHRLGSRKSTPETKPDDGSGGDAGDTQPEAEAFGIQPLGAEWKHKVSRVVDLDGRATFTRLTARQEYRLVLEFRKVKFQATQSFRVDSNRLVTLQAAIPPLSEGAGGKARRKALLPMVVFVNYRSSGTDSREPGFYWK